MTHPGLLIRYDIRVLIRVAFSLWGGKGVGGWFLSIISAELGLTHKIKPDNKSDGRMIPVISACYGGVAGG